MKKTSDVTIRVLAPGTKVLIGFPKTAMFLGVIAGVWFKSATDYEYEVEWWSGRERKKEWMRSDEVHQHDKSCETIRVGFA